MQRSDGFVCWKCCF